MRIIFLALVAALMLTACGGGDPTTTNPQSSPTGEPSKDSVYDSYQDGGLPAETSVEADIYVDPARGNDSDSGANGEPVRSLTQAQALVRKLKAAEPTRQTPILVLLRGGTYTLDETLVFGTQDSGTETAPVIYKAHPGERPVISGGVILNGWNVGTDGRWQLSIPEAADNGWGFTQLWSDGQRRFRPRLPKNGYRSIQAKAAPLSGDKDNRFEFQQGDLDPNWHNLFDVEVLAWHKWTISRLRLAEVNVPSTTATLNGTTRCSKYYCQLLPEQRFIVENVFEALSEPGEWYLDSTTGQLTYLPYPDENPDDTTIVVPRLQTLVRVEGDGPGAQTANIAFEGIAFAHTHWQTPATGYSSNQSENRLGGAIELRFANDIRFSNCSIEHTGEYGIAILDDSHNNRIEGCVLSDLGAGGIKVGMGDYIGNEEQVTSHNVIRDNLITAGGRMHPAGAGVLIQHSAHNTVEHNDINDFYYSGISVGWSWGFGSSNAHDNDIGYNHVQRIGQAVLSDLGGVYTTGISPGTKIHHNIFQDISRIEYGGWGIYLDEGSADLIVENNLVHSTQDSPFNLNFGRNLTLRNNILIADGVGVLTRNQKTDVLALTVRNNILASNKQEVLQKEWSDGQFSFDANLYWIDGAPPLFNGRTIGDWKASGQDLNSQVADPLFADPSSGDYRLAPASPALALGLAAIDLSTAGRLSSPRADDLPPAPRAFPAALSSGPLEIDFEMMDVGTTPADGVSSIADGSGSLLVSDAAGALGTKKSLQFIDAPDISKGSQPRLKLETIGDSSGTYRLAFSLRWLTNTTVNVQLREHSESPYYDIVGPNINVNGGRLEVGGNTLTTLNAGQWVRLEIAVPLGDAADGSYSVTVTPEGENGAAQTFPGQRFSAPFKRVNTIIFSSEGKSAQEFFIDEISAYVE